MAIRTLLIDDELLARERLRLLLKDQEDIEIVDEAGDGLEALQKIKGCAPDLVFLDIEMPGFNGFKVVQSLDQQPLPKVIFVTAYDRYAVEAFEAGAIDYLLKPVKKSRLRESIQRAKQTMAKPGHDLLLAAAVQRRLLPDRDLRLAGLETAGACLAVNQVGGDYYDFIPLSHERLGICLADISGKGFSAALMMANLQATLKILAKEISEPAALVAKINALFYENSVAEMYATLFYGVYDSALRVLTCCNAGHHPPLWSCAGLLQKLERGGTVVGMFADSAYEQESIALQPGDSVVAYSDGLIELQSAGGEEFGEPRLRSLLQTHHQLSAADLKGLLLEEARRFMAGRSPQDDLTIAILKVVA